MTLQKLFSNRKHWTTEAYARSTTGRVVKSESPDAVCWCLRGAVYKCYPQSEAQDRVLKKLDRFLRGSGFYNIVFFNDSPDTTFDQIQRLVKLANV